MSNYKNYIRTDLIKRRDELTNFIKVSQRELFFINNLIYSYSGDTNKINFKLGNKNRYKSADDLKNFIEEIARNVINENKGSAKLRYIVEKVREKGFDVSSNYVSKSLSRSECFISVIGSGWKINK